MSSLQASAPAAQPRYRLTILNYPSAEILPELCELIYQTRDKNLMASLSTVPYIVGRSFFKEEAHLLNGHLKELKVGHHFHSNSQDLEDIHFDPRTKKASDLTKGPNLNQQNSSFGSLVQMIAGLIAAYKALFIFTLILVAAAVAANWYWRSQSSSQASGSDRVSVSKMPTDAALQALRDDQARIEEIIRDVEYRKNHELIWNRAEKKITLDQKDNLRTFENSYASLKYREGSTVLVRPNTQITIGDQGPATDRQLKLAEGDLQARLLPDDKPKTLSIETASGTLELRNPKPGEKLIETRVETSVAQGQLKVSVSEGSAVLHPLAKDAAPLEIKTNEEVIATSKTVSSPRKFIPSLKLMWPLNNSKVIINVTRSSEISFEWEPAKPNEIYFFEIAADENFESILMSERLNKPSIKLNYLDPGSIYWRVKTLGTKPQLQSPTFRLYVETDRK